jgi:ribosomal-protein-alanine N-acetyltransferase
LATGRRLFEDFDERLGARIHEDQGGVSLFFVILDKDDEVLRRVNISDIGRPESTELGFRVAEDTQGRDIATQGVISALMIAA